MARPDKKMVGIAKDDLRLHFQQILRCHCLDGALGSNRHKDRGLENTLPGTHCTSSRSTFGRTAVKSEW
jgi:hypothetical protein